MLENGKKYCQSRKVGIMMYWINYEYEVVIQK